MSAPSFSSFQPSFTSFPEQEPSPAAQSASRSKKSKDKSDKDRKDRNRVSRSHRHGDETEPDRSKSHHRRDKDKEKKRSRRHEQEGSDSGDGRRTRKQSRRNNAEDYSLKSDPLSQTGPRLFFEDRVGDSLNVRYGGLHAGDVSIYRLIAGGKRVLGLDKGLVILKDEGKYAIVGLPEMKSKVPELTDRRTRILLLEKPRPIRSLSKHNYSADEDIIRLSKSRKGKEAEQAYRSITKDDDDNSDSSQSSESDSSDEEPDTIPLTAREEAIRELERTLKAQPTSVEDWIRLIDKSLNDVSDDAKDIGRARKEITISILDRAMDAHSDNERSPTLWWKLLRAAEDIWDKDKLKREWEHALDLARSVDLWVEWLDWKIRTCSRFEDAIASSTRALESVSKICTGVDADMAKLRVFWRAIIFLRQAGYTERAFGSLQAEAELCLNIPENYRQQSFEKQIEALETFWDSEQLRIGEKGAKGWRASVSSQAKDDQETLDAWMYNINEYDGQDAFDMWSFIESRSDRKLIYPARASNEDVEDPYSIILFHDIQPLLFPLSTKEGREKLRMIFISFLGVHIPGLSSSLSASSLNTDDRWADLALMRDPLIDGLFPRSNSSNSLIADSMNGAAIGQEKSYRSGLEIPPSWTLGTFDILEGISLKSLRFKVDNSPVNRSTRLEEETEVQAVEAFFDQTLDITALDWTLQSLAYRAVNEVGKDLVKYSQNLLEKNSTSPALLAAHAYVERIARKVEKAQKVYSVALSSLKPMENIDMVHVWWGTTELHWLRSQRSQAVKSILGAADQSDEASGVNILRAKHRLHERIQTSHLAWDICLKWIKLRILLEILTNSLDEAIRVGMSYMAAQQEGQTRHESLTMALLLLVYDHTMTLRNHAPPSLLQGLVREALDIYPSNSLILGLFLECEKGQGVWGRIRELLAINSHDSMREKTVSRRIMDVWIASWEKGRWIGEVERVRAGLEAAVTSDRTKGSPIIWKLLVKFEVAAGDLKKAKLNLYRAIGTCPLVKELYLLAFDDKLRKVFSKRELITLADTMAERGLRLRDSLGELMHNYAELLDDEGDGPDKESDGENEMEHASRELRRLMPL